MTAHTFTYFLDQELSQRFRTPVISLNLSKALDAASLCAKVLGAEKAMMMALIDHEFDWRKREAKIGKADTLTPFHFFRLRPSLSYELLQKLACTQRLIYNKKPLICDFFSRLSLEYIVEPQELDCVRISAFLSNQTSSYKLSECQLLLQGAPHMIVKEPFLRFINEEVSWQELNGFDKEKIVTKAEYASFLKELRSQEHAPQIHELKGTEPPDQPIDPLPTLVLTDSTCAFANLFMQYGAKRSPFNEFTASSIEKAFEKDLIEAGFSRKPVAAARYYCQTDRAISAVQFLLEVGWKVYDQKGSELLAIDHTAICLEKEAESYILQGSVSFGSHEADIALFAGAIHRKERFLSLGAGKAGLLCLDKHGALVSLLQEVELVSNTPKITKHSLSLVSELVEDNVLTVADPIDQLLFKTMKKPELLPNELLSKEFKGELRSYQQVGVNWMKSLFKMASGGILADEMGLGKTVQVLGFLSTHATDLRTLIVAPTTLLHHWKQEALSFLPSSRLLLFHGLERNPEQLDNNYDMIITSYGTLRADVALFQNQSFDCLILDEAQAIKNQETQIAQSLKKINARFRLSLTGTPVENSLQELLSHFQFLNPGLLKETYSLPQIRQKIAPFFLRRKKSDVAKELPEKIEQTIIVPMSESQKSLYTKFQKTLSQGLLKKIATNGTQKLRMEILEAILRLRQICCHPALVPQIADELGEKSPLTSGKCDLLLEDIETLMSEGKKIVVFSQFSSMLTLLSKESRERGWQPLVLDGQTKNRMELVDRFQNDPSVSLFLMSLKAGGVGLNLTKADYVLLYDPWWNRAQELQAIDRAHRIGRKETVFCKRYVMKESIEEKILELQEKKSALIEALFEGEENATALSGDDLAELLT